MKVVFARLYPLELCLPGCSLLTLLGLCLPGRALPTLVGLCPPSGILPTLVRLYRAAGAFFEIDHFGKSISHAK